MKIASLLIIASLSVSISVFADMQIFDLQKIMKDDLILAAGQGDTDAVRALLDKGTNVNLTDDSGGTALSYAVHYSKLNTVHLLLVRGADANSGPRGLFTPLVEALSNGDLDIVAELLAHGADVNLHCSLEGYTALMVASLEGDLDIVKELLARGARINEKNKDGKTALAFAEIGKKRDVMKYLKQHGATK
ncbi:MAG TPA: ankyrin repeat domain-containing protein [Thermoanaerobaculia bacterium]|nr:ankyrin repeat domain-containing protein [Thermoanaerobaculia bacterium]